MNEGVRDGRSVLTVTVAATLVLALVIFYAGFPALAASVVPELLPGASNQGKTCADNQGSGQTWLELKLEGTAGELALTNGAHTDRSRVGHP